MFFPDPWPKPRHHKRRLVTAAFADLAASRLKPGGTWRVATDSAGYAAWISAILEADPHFANEHPNGEAPRWEARPVSQFEQRGLDAGRAIVDLAYRRVN